MGGIFFESSGGNGEGSWWIGIVVILGTRLVFADGFVLGLRICDVHRSAHFDEFKEFPSCILVDAKATMGAWSWPDRSHVESIGGIKGHPILHGESHIAMSGAMRFTAFARDDGIAIGPKAIGHRAFVLDFFHHTEVAFGGRGFGLSDGRGSDEKGLISLEHINHPVLQRDFDADVVRIFWLVAYGVVVFPRQCGGIAASQRKGDGAKEKQET